MESITELPKHIVALIVQQLPVEERCRCCVISKAFNALNCAQQLGPILTLRPQQVGDAHFLRWAAGRLSGVTALHVLPCHSARDRIAQSNLTGGLCTLLSLCGTGALKTLCVPDAISLNHAVLSHLPASLEAASLSVAFDDSCMDNTLLGTYAFPADMPRLRRLHLQVTCVNVRSYGLVTIPSSLPASLESMWVGTKARGRRIGPSLLMPKASDMPNVRDIELDATCFICHEGDSSLAAFLSALPRLEAVRLRSDIRAVDYHSALLHLPGLKRKHWEAL